MNSFEALAQICRDLVHTCSFEKLWCVKQFHARHKMPMNASKQAKIFLPWVHWQFKFKTKSCCYKFKSESMQWHATSYIFHYVILLKLNFWHAPSMFDFAFITSSEIVYEFCWELCVLKRRFKLLIFGCLPESDRRPRDKQSHALTT